MALRPVYHDADRNTAAVRRRASPRVPPHPGNGEAWLRKTAAPLAVGPSLPDIANNFLHVGVRVIPDARTVIQGSDKMHEISDCFGYGLKAAFVCVQDVRQELIQETAINAIRLH